MPSLSRRPVGRGLAVVLIALMIQAGCVVSSAPDLVPGLAEHQQLGAVPVPGGLYHVAGGNLLVSRSDLSVDTRILAGTSVDVHYSSATRRWHWSHAMHYDGATFVDDLGTVFDVASLPDGAAVPGSHWVRLDADRVKTKGGLVHTFDAQGRLDAVHWSSDPYPRYRYQHDPETVEVRECAVATLPLAQCRLVFTIELSVHGPTRVIDEESARAGTVREARYGYDVLGRLKTAHTPFEWDEGLSGTRYEYTPGGLLTAQVSSEGERIEYEWLFGWLSQVTEVGEESSHHAFGYPQQVEGAEDHYRLPHANALGGVTWYAFTGEGFVTEVDRSDAGERLVVEWDEALRRPVRVVGFDGAVWEFRDFVDDDPTSVIEPSGNVWTVVYAPHAVDLVRPRSRPIASLADTLGVVETRSYDTAGRPVARTNGEGETTSLSYLGSEVAGATTPWGGQTDFTSYGVHGHWQTAEPSWLPEVVLRRQLDRVGNLTVPGAGLQIGGVLERTHDGSRSPAAIEVAAVDDQGRVTSTDTVALERRSDGRLLSVTRPGGAHHVFAYDARGRRVSRSEAVDGAWHDTLYGYDAAGNLTFRERPNGMREEWDHDVYGRVVERRLLQHGALEAHALFEWQDGRLSRWYDSVRDQWETFGYDGAGRLRTVHFGAVGEVMTRDLDLRSRVVRRAFQVGAFVREIEIEWDLANRRTRVFTRDVDGAAQDLTRFTYADGRLTAIEYGNGLLRENLYDPVKGRFEGHRTTDLGTGEEVEETVLTREAMAGPSRLEVTSWTRTPLATTEERYELGLGGNLQTLEGRVGSRVMGWQGKTWIDGILQDESSRRYAWDERSNRRDDGAGGSFVYNAERNRLLASSSAGVDHDFAYDAAGFVVDRDGLPMTWTADGRLATLGPAASPVVALTWDLAGRLVSSEVAGTVRSYALFGGRVEIDVATGQPGWLQLTHGALPFVGDERRYRHLDPLGNVSFVTDDTGAFTSHRRYHPFGLDASYGAGSGGDATQGFVGGTELQYQGLATGLVVLGARILDSDVGRFLSPDPVFDLVNAYTYAYGNPVDYEDDDGRLASVKLGEAMAAALEAKAAELDASAAKLDTASSQAMMAAGVFALIALAKPGALAAAGVAGLVAQRLDTKAEAQREEASRLRARAAEIRLGIAVDTLLAPVLESRDLVGDPTPPCGPSLPAAWTSAGGPMRPVVLLLLLASLLVAFRRPMVPSAYPPNRSQA